MNKTSNLLMTAYLKDRIDTLIDYITSTNASKDNHSILAFVDTIDNWDWEIENVIFAISNLKERNDFHFSITERIINVRSDEISLDNKLKALLNHWNDLLLKCQPILNKTTTETLNNFEIIEGLDLTPYFKGINTYDRVNNKIAQ